MEHKLLHPSHIFALFKYAVYLALVWNAWLFFQEDWQAAVFRLDELSLSLIHISEPTRPY